MIKNENTVQGMPMFAPGDPDLVVKEKQELRELQSKRLTARYKWYFAKSGPGWMQSAMTLGGGKCNGLSFCRCCSTISNFMGSAISNVFGHNYAFGIISSDTFNPNASFPRDERIYSSCIGVGLGNSDFNINYHLAFPANMPLLQE